MKKQNWLKLEEATIYELFNEIDKNISSDYLIEMELNKRIKYNSNLKLLKNNAKKILRPLGFYKRKNEKWEFVKNFGDKRIHIKRQKGGFFWHIDNHN